MGRVSLKFFENVVKLKIAFVVVVAAINDIVVFVNVDAVVVVVIVVVVVVDVVDAKVKSYRRLHLSFKKLINRKIFRMFGRDGNPIGRKNQHHSVLACQALDFYK